MTACEVKEIVNTIIFVFTIVVAQRSRHCKLLSRILIEKRRFLKKLKVFVKVRKFRKRTLWVVTVDFNVQITYFQIYHGLKMDEYLYFF